VASAFADAHFSHGFEMTTALALLDSHRCIIQKQQEQASPLVSAMSFLFRTRSLVASFTEAAGKGLPAFMLLHMIQTLLINGSIDSCD
jgi:hypothetical protein